MTLETIGVLEEEEEDVDVFAFEDVDDADVFEAEFDETLDHLLKYAMKSETQEPDTGHVWQRLSKRVQGPFGYTALEAPGCDSLETEMLMSGRAQQAPFVISERAMKRSQARSHDRPTATDSVWDMLRFGSSGRAIGNSVGVLA